MIDLDQLERSASLPGESAVVTRRFLAQAVRELREGRECIERRGSVFGLPKGEKI